MAHMQLDTCEKIEKDDPSGRPSYRQRLYYDNKKLVISTAFYQMQSLKLKECKIGYSLSIPIDSWTRQQLNCLESFTMKNAKIPHDLSSTWKVTGKCTTPYKPFWNGSTITMNLSKWCKLTINSEDCGELTDSISRLKDGLYQFDIEFPHIYFGEHKNNFLCSITSRIVKVNYQCSNPPKTLDVVDELLSDLTSSEPPKKKKGRKPKKDNETL